MENKQKIISYSSALSRAQYLCARQERCEYDIRTKLRQWNVSNDDIEKVIKQLIIDSFISDERYTRMFVRDKIRFNKWGPIKIAQALRGKRIPDAFIQESLKEFGATNDDEILTDLLKKKARTIKAKSPFDLRNKLIRFGVSRGFEYGKVIGIVDKFYKEIDN